MYYVDENGKVSMKKTSTTKKKKKQQEQVHYTVDDNGKVTMNNIEDIAPVKQTTSKEKNKKWYEGYLQLGDALKDGYQFGDLTKSYTATASDLTENLTAGIVGMGEKIVDAGAYIAGGVGGLFGADDFKKKTKKFIEKDLYDEKKVAEKLVSIGINPLNTNQPLVWADKILNGKKEDNSVLGNKTDSLVQSGGQLLATTGLQMVGVPWYLTTGVTAFGEQTETAFREGATFKQAGGSALVSAGAEVLFEKLGGGIKFGGKTLDDALLRPLTEKISNKVLKATVNLGLDATGEGAEEVLTSVASRLGTSLYKEESIDELLTSEEAMDEYIDSFVGGALMGGVAGTGRTITNNTKTATLTENEKKVVDKEFENRISEAEKDGKKLSEKDKTKIYDEVLNDLDKGYISTDTIESAIGDKTYETYKTMEEQENSIREEIESLENTPKEQFTVKQDERLKELREELAKIDKTQVKNQLSSEVSELAKVDRLSESYNEKARRSQTFEADLTKYDTKQQEVIKRATESGILNNTNRTHEFVDMVAKISADKGVLFDFTNNQKLKESGFAVEGKTVNGYVKDGNIAVNIDSNKSLNTIVGHEITHVLEGTELYTELQEAVKNYATTKGDYDTRIKELTELYKDVEGANIEGEVTADLVGDYLFTDKDFINNLSVEKPNIFKKIYNEIKYLYKMATAGSKEARQLEKVKRTFENAYKENISKNSDTKHSFSGSRAKTANSSLLLRAEHMLDTGVDSETVRQETGWFKGYDGKMRFEIDDYNSSLVENPKLEKHYDYDGDSSSYYTANLQDVLKHDKLFEAYPQLKDVLVIIQETEVGVRGIAFPKDKQIVLSLDLFKRKTKEYQDLLENRQNYIDEIEKTPEFKEYNRFYDEDVMSEMPTEEWLKEEQKAQKKFYDSELGKKYYELKWGKTNIQKTELGWSEEAKSVLMHEIQHSIQYIEGFTRGSNERYWQRKLDAGEVIQTKEQKAELTELRKQYEDVRENEPEFFKEMNELEEMTPTVSRGAIDWDTLEQIEEDPIEWQNFDKQRESLEQKYGDEKVHKFMSLNHKIKDRGARGISAYQAYHNTAGEIEARDTANRLSLNEEQRKATRPDIDKEDVVYSDNAKYSLSDSNGKELTKEQQEYFKDSKVRDENGNLKVMYHGTSNGGHTVFDIYGSNFGLFGQGTYFTDNKSVAESYTNKGRGNNKQVYEVYLNITNPMDMDAQANIEEWQNAFPDADFSTSKTNEDCFKAMKEYFFDNEYTKYEAYEEAWDAITGMGYDGLTHIGGGRFNKADDTRHRVYIAYEPEQIKNIDNTKPTSDADIRFSLSKPVEKTKDLVAIHNLNSDKLLSIMELGGFPMPSVAITKDTASHEGYGDITVVLKPNAIDPESNSDNKVFSADAYTPTFPATAYKLDTAELRKLAKKLDTSASMLEVNEFSSGNLSDVLNNFTKNKGAKELFVKEKGYTVEPVLRPRELNDKYLERAKEIVTSDDFSFDKLVNDLNYRENYFDKIKENSKNYGKITFVTRTVDKYINDTNEMLDIASNEKNLAEALNNQYMSDIEQLKGKGTLVEDKNSYIDGLNNLINEKSDEFNAFVKELIEPVLSSKYLRNNKNYYTESGNPRTFESLHEEYNAENAVKIMRENSDTNAVNSMLGVSLGELKAVLSKQYNSIEEMHQDKTRISEDFNEEIQAKHEECRTKFFDITKQLAETATLDNSFTAHDYAGRTILDALAKSKNAKGIYNYINKNYTGSITMELAKDIENLAKDIMELPVHYFESKPQRVVGFDEVGAVVLPYNADAKLKQQLLNNGLSIAEYNPDIEGDRKRVVNQFEDYKFSLANREQITAPYGNYNVYGKDIALEQAPVENTFINDETQTANNLLGIIANRDIKDHNVVVEDYQREQLAKKIEAIVSESNGNNKKLFELLASETRKNEDNLKAIYDIEQKWIAENKKQSDKADMPDYIHNMVSTARFYRDMLDDATQSLASKGKFDGNTLFKAILENEQVNQDYAPLTEEQANERDAEQSITSMPTEEFEKLVQSYMDDAPSFMLDDDEIRAWAEEQARQNPQGAIPKESIVIPESPLEERNIDEVGNRKINAYMYENPEVKPFFQEEAQKMLWELENSTDGKRGRKGASYGLGEEIGAFEGDWYGTKRQTSDELAYLRDNFKYDKDDLTKGLKAIIEDHGAENNAISKRIEFMLDERLREGYKDFMSNERMPANQGYINLLNEKQITEYNDEAFSNWAKTLNEDSIPTDTMQEDIAPIQQAEEMQMPTMTRPSEPNIINVPSTPSPDGKQRKWVGTSTESEPVDRKILPKDLDQNKITYQPIPNKKTLNNANSMLDRDGYDESVTYFNSQFKNKRVSLDDIALGERLIQEAVKKGDMATAGELIQNVSILGTELGQKVQALSIIQRLTPEGQLKTLNKIVERGKAKGDKAFEGVEITQEMIDHILKTYGKDGTYNQEELDKAVEDVKKDIAKQMKVTKMDKVNAWRYLSMLGNPKTHVRNIVSNVGMKGTMAVKDALARTIETVAPVKNRTKTWKPASNDVKEFAKQTTKEMQSILDDGGKYSDTNDIKAKRQIFKNKVLNAVYEFNSDMLSKEDWWFQSSAFNKAFSEYLTANGISTKEDIQNNAELIEKAKAYATEQSEIATFKQYSFIAHKLNEIESKNTATQIATGAIVPFKKTPVNIAKTGLNYSPLGFMKTLTYDASQVKKGNMEASQMIDNLSQNITGTGLALAGYMLAMSGFLNGAGKEDKEGKYDYQLGKQAYSVNIGGNTYSLSWLTPVAMPLFVGANAFETLTEGKEWDGNVVIEALTQTLDPMSEMSVLSGLTNVLSSYEKGSGIWADIAQTTGQNYVTQFVPTLSGQIATAMDDKQRSTKVAGNSGFKFLEETVNKLKLKIPGLRETLEPSTDVWGNEVKLNENKMQKVFDTFIAPYSRKESTATQIDEELKDLYADTGDGGLFPQTPKNSVNYDGEKYNMSAKEYTSFKKTYGQNALDLMEELFQTTTYQNASSSEKTEMVDKVYDYASDEAKREYLAKKDVEFTNATKDGEAYYKENNIKGAIENDMPLEEFDFYNNYPEKYEFLQSNNISYEEYNKDKETREAYNWAFKNPERYTLSKSISKDLVTYKTYTADISKFRADTDRYGKTIRDSKKKKVLNYINGLDAEYGEKLILYKSIYYGDDTHNYEIINYLNNRDDITFDEMNTILKELGFTVTTDGTIYWN
jgi:hypothetical protein